MQRQEANLTAVTEHDIALWKRVIATRVFFAFAVNVGAKAAQRFDRRWLVEDHHIIDHFESSNHLCAIFFRDDRTRGTFITFDAGVAVEAHNQDVAKRLRIPQAANVAGMQEVETAVGPDNYLALRAPVVARFHQLIQTRDF